MFNPLLAYGREKIHVDGVRGRGGSEAGEAGAGVEQGSSLRFSVDHFFSSNNITPSQAAVIGVEHNNHIILGSNVFGLKELA